MEFKEFFNLMKNRISDGMDIPEFFPELISMITNVPDEKWDTPKDPATTKTKENTIRSFVKSGLSKKFARSVVYNLQPENFVDSINSRDTSIRQLLASDYIAYDATANAANIGKLLADCFVETIKESAGLVDNDLLAAQKRQQVAVDLKRKYGEFLLSEADYVCAFPGCGNRLSITNKGKITYLYEVGIIDKQKAPEIDNLLALCPRCYGLYSIDDDKKKMKELSNIKKVLNTRLITDELLSEANLEKGIVGVITKVSKIKSKDLENASLDPKEIVEKLSPDENVILYNTVRMYVMTYFVRVREIITNLDKRGEIDYEEIQDLIHGLYRKLKKAKKSNTEIFNDIVSKIHSLSMQDEIYCQIVVSYFIQSCEVFDAITK